MEGGKEMVDADFRGARVLRQLCRREEYLV
jgi:hypothetical protein